MPKEIFQKAKTNKNDEFYTSLVDIENEVKHYWNQLEGKKIWCNCDDPEWSNFHHFFEAQQYFHNFEIKYTSYQLVPNDLTNYAKKELDKSWAKKNSQGKIEILNYCYVDSEGFCKGDFRAKEQEKLWKWADVIITNPPFSLFREFIDMIMKYEKKFLIVGGQHAITYKENFKYIQANKMWLGVNYHLTGFEKIDENGNKIIYGKNDAVARTCTWFTNLENPTRNRPITLCDWDSEKFIKYDNYDVYETVWLYGKKGGSRAEYPFTKNVLGVPITFLQKYCPKQFNILDLCNGTPKINPEKWGKNGWCSINGEYTYARIFIQMTKEYYEELKEVFENE